MPPRGDRHEGLVCCCLLACYEPLQILSRIGMLDPRMPLFLSLLHAVCRHHGHLVGDLSSKIKVGVTCPRRVGSWLVDHHGFVRVQESLEYLHHLPSAAANFFLAALGPLLQQRRELREALMLVLRKAVFQRSIESRTVAVDGSMALLTQGSYCVLHAA